MKQTVLSLLFAFACAACHRHKPVDPVADIPDLPGDTIYVSRVVSRCNYQYLSADPGKARKQLQTAEKALDDLIIEYDARLKQKGKTASRLINQSQKP